jgi:flagellar basal body rod protein FlgG
MQANEYRHALIANNLANMETVGFKRDLAVIHERLVESKTNPNGLRYADPLFDGQTGGPWVRPTYHSFEQGPLVHTGGTLDVAVQGPSFFTVRDGEQLRYTRDGRFSINERNELVTVAGQGRIKVLDDAGNPIVVPDKDVTISANGTVRSGGAVVARLGLVDVDDTRKLRKVGMNLFSGTDAQRRPATGRLANGFVEGSTVSPVQGLATMIEVSRAYETNARMISLQDTMNGLAVSRVGRIG